ncbi:uncharacterized protein THITE_121363 [Thermothielavioides terrestris NRRL 8126]|uniref:Uncharacterized protein n=2 Tax=Thermothielavioides terrestris TaxID=2587410 RepID=G2QU05_THETT|nr:uncharacterized protein THITE_121363 [Thermothielavioides terrestris NRRL 8126]AEO63664.1 hypothetical protein THITE_121363 [Thermothielavioides terrestris NRRL 8126]QXF69090.1 preasperterpenoid [Thermothielavioides terrestris]
MESNNSVLADPSTYPADLAGLCPKLPVRVSRNPELADRGALRAQSDWKSLFGSLPRGFAGTMGPEHNLIATCLPEALPDRIELVTYACEIALLAYDAIEGAEDPMAAAAPFVADLLQASQFSTEHPGEVEPHHSPAGGLLAQVCRAIVTIDPRAGRDALRWVAKWTATFMTLPKHREFRDLEHYLEHRRVDVSSDAFLGMAVLSMGLNIPEEQQQACLELSEPLWRQLSLAKDYVSWEREFMAASAHDDMVVNNAVWVLMKQHAMTCEEAQAVCRERANRYAAEYLQVLETVDARDDLCADAKSLLHTLQLAMSGNVVWCLQSPRYNPARWLSTAQLEIAKAVGAEEAHSWSRANPLAVNGDIKNANGRAHGLSVNGVSHRAVPVAVAVVRDVPALSTEVLEAPSRYVDTMPSKGFRDRLIDALNLSFRVPPEEVATIKKLVNLLHGASLMLDDIQDGSAFRRGRPATHLVFGQGLTINSAAHCFLDALREGVRELYIAQSHDLTWTANLRCPTEDEYLAMVDGKTGGLFQMSAKLLDAKSVSPERPDLTLLTRLMRLFDRLIQIREDYMNLTSTEKGFSEDLDERIYSLPLIHALGRCQDDRAPEICGAHDATLLRSMLSQRRAVGEMTLEQKKVLLQHLKDRGSLEYTRDAMAVLMAEIRSLSSQMGLLENAKWTALLEAVAV